MSETRDRFDKAHKLDDSQKARRVLNCADMDLVVLVYLWGKIRESGDEVILRVFVKTILGFSLFRCKFIFEV